MNVLYEDNHIIVVEKPINVPVQADSSGDIDMLSMVKSYVKDKYNKPGDVFIGLVHRLDRPVGGVMVFARTSKAASRLSEQIRLKKISKIYLSISESKHDKTSQTQRLEHYILKDEKQNKVRIEDNPFPSAKQAILYYSVVDKQSDFCLIKVELETGRTHQIRAQLSKIGLPLWGDQKYGNGVPGQQLALWSHEMEFEHPIKKEIMNFKSNPPLKAAPWNNFEIII